MTLKYFLTAFVFTNFLYAAPECFDVAKSGQDPKKDLNCEAPKEEAVTTKHVIEIDEVPFFYQATVGTQLLTDEQGSPKASIFYTAYTKDSKTDLSDRPITFCFNGGPGSSSVWLHLGTFGPKRVSIDDEGKVANQPYHLVDNPYSILDVSDLVFIDPVSTGFSRAVPVEESKQFHGVESDIESIAEFIRLYVTRNNRWESPKFLAGESYGTTRAAGLALQLHDIHHLTLNGIILISSVLNFQTIRFSNGNDLPYILFLPSYAASALYHHKLSAELQQDPTQTLREVERFAMNEYTQALMLGDRIDSGRKGEIIEKLSKYTGLSPDYIDRSHLRLDIFRFTKELLRDERRTIGRFDSRVKGIDLDFCESALQFDPSSENIFGLFTSTFNQYVRTELNWHRDAEYKILADVQPWDYGSAINQFLNVGEDLREVMSKNTTLEVFVASGYTDLATPYFATEYTFGHLGLDPSLRNHVVIKNYEGGHMMYLYYPSLVKLKADLSYFFEQSLAENKASSP